MAGLPSRPVCGGRPQGFAIYDVDPETEEPAGRFEVSTPRAPEP